METIAVSRETQDPYAGLLSAAAGRQWRRIGTRRRSGVAVPLFSVHSRKSIGVGELPDLKLLVDWCKASGLSIIQLLPMNDTGNGFRPYDAESANALEPAYLALRSVKGVPVRRFDKALRALARRFPAGKRRVDWKVKRAKLEILAEMFRSRTSAGRGGFDAWKRENAEWLENYAAYRVLKELYGGGWESWPDKFRHRGPEALASLGRESAERMEFFRWVQWQLFLQFRDARKYASSKGVFLMGDLPFLVSRDSAEVWARQDHFKLDLVAGAPPDAFFSGGQRWGMPPYRWDRIAADGHRYLLTRLRYAGNFYDLFRIDHVIGIFRLWTIPAGAPHERQGLDGTYDPPDEASWEAQGRGILGLMLANSEMLPCAEDLGVVPPVCTRVLEEYGIPGIDIQRWTRDWNGTNEFIAPERTRRNSAAMISTHDTSPLGPWWRHEAGTVDAGLFERKCREMGIAFEAVKERLFDAKRSAYGRLRWRPGLRRDDVTATLARPAEEAGELIRMFQSTVDEREKFLRFLGLDPRRDKMTPEFVTRAIRKSLETASIFSIQLLQDWLLLDRGVKTDSWDFRINFPGTFDKRNWTIVLPRSLEEMKRMPANRAIRGLVRGTGRI